ncbi:MAG: dipeptidase [Flavobacteriales bacterium]|nr:dipeptidase [Flavobacteriales bacterium]
MRIIRLLPFFLSPFFLFSTQAQAQQVHEYIDLQIHPCMHVPYSFFGEGLQTFDETNLPDLSWKHQFTNVNYANYLRKNKGARILCVGALTQENIVSAKRGRKMIMKQIKFVNDFVAANAIDFAVARTPQEVRNLVHTTDKTIIIHSIEGGKRLVNSQEDANFWAEQGVAFITLVHLVDSKYGAAANQPVFALKILNFGSLFRKEKNRRLTGKGKNAIVWLANAGIMTDITHMSDNTRKDALALMEEKHIPPLVTHDMFKPIQNQPRGMEEEDVLKVYANNGFVSLPISGESCQPYNPRADYQAKLDALSDHCEGSIDSYKFTYEEVKKFLEKELPADQVANLSIGFQTDFNGWLNHHRPRYGEEGCFPINPDSTYEAIELQGLAHPGLLESHWRLLEKEGVDLEPIKRSSEKFLQMWEYVLENKAKF